jgi:hypothetical protein
LLLTALAATSISTVIPSSTEYGQITTAAVVEESTDLAIANKTEEIVRSYFRDIPVMIQIARCESTFRHTLPDGSILKGKVDPADTGVMQINKRYHREKAASMNLNLDDIYHNMAYARYLYETQGTKPWSASAPCWNGNLAMNI